MERLFRVLVGVGSVLLVLMGAKIKLWPPVVPSEIATWGLWFVGVAVLMLLAVIGEACMSWWNQRERERVAEARHQELVREVTYSAGVQHGGMAALSHLVTTAFARITEGQAGPALQDQIRALQEQ